MKYNDMLSPYDNKGTVGKEEWLDSEELAEKELDLLVDTIKSCEGRDILVLTGAGISTGCGIPDFRGKNGVWTREKMGLPAEDIDFSSVNPGIVHRALVELEKKNKIGFLISQNVDNLHLKSGFPREKLYEVHGNLFMEKCNKCHREYMRDYVVPSVGFKPTGNKCEGNLRTGRSCRGKLHDATLDWENELDAVALNHIYVMLKTCKVFLVLGTSLEIEPIGSMPLEAQKNGAHVLTVNLQNTAFESKMQHKIHANVDTVMKSLCKKLDIEI